MILLLAAAVAFTVPKPPAPMGFFAYHGTNGVWTNKVFLGYPQVTSNQWASIRANTNCFVMGNNCTASVPVLYFSTNISFPRGNSVVLTVTNKDALESDYSCVMSCSQIQPTNVSWLYPIPPGPAVTNIVIVSSGTNSIGFTNPAQAFTWYRLRGLSWTSAVLQANWNNPPSWSSVTVWSYPSNRTPSLTVQIQH